MTAITRERLDALDTSSLDHLTVTLILALRRVLDLRDGYRASLGPNEAGEVLAYVCGDLDAALAGTQTDALAFTTSCAPSGCSCSGHRMPGVHHVVACCDQPHADGLGTQTDDGAVTPQAIERIAAAGVTPAGEHAARIVRGQS